MSFLEGTKITYLTNLNLNLFFLLFLEKRWRIFFYFFYFSAVHTCTIVQNKTTLIYYDGLHKCK